MNKKIKEISEKAAIRFGYHPEHPRIDTAVIIPSDLEKFAEFLIQECMDVVKDINQEYDGGSTVVNAAEEIKEHFKM